MWLQRAMMNGVLVRFSRSLILIKSSQSVSLKAVISLTRMIGWSVSQVEHFVFDSWHSGSAWVPTAAQAGHALNWRKIKKLCQDGTRNSRLCGTKPWTRPISENKRNRRPHGMRVFMCFRGMWHKSRRSRR